MALEVTTVADDEVVVFDGARALHHPGLVPETAYELHGLEVRTLRRPPGELLCRFATVNDVHFGETDCGVLTAFPDSPVFRSEPGALPYPQVMNRAAIAAMAAVEPAVVVVKGDLTDRGTDEEYAEFLAAYEPAFGDRLVHVRGNHDSYHGGTHAAFPAQLVEVPGARLAVLDTAQHALESGHLDAGQLEWLDDVAADAGADGVPLVVLGHHHAWDPHSDHRDPTYYGIDCDSSEALVELVARRPAIVGYLAGHTHRNRRRSFAATGDVPWVEVACVKDFPGAWAEYKVYEGGLLQVFHRIEGDDALAWTEKTRQLYGGFYEHYAMGELTDRCFELPLRG